MLSKINRGRKTMPGHADLADKKDLWKCLNSQKPHLSTSDEQVIGLNQEKSISVPENLPGRVSSGLNIREHKHLLSLIILSMVTLSRAFQQHCTQFSTGNQ